VPGERARGVYEFTIRRIYWIKKIVDCNKHGGTLVAKYSGNDEKKREVSRDEFIQQ